MILRSIRLKHRIALGFIILQLIVAGLGAVSVVFIDRATKGTADLHHHAFVVSSALGEMRNRILEIKAALLHQVTFDDDENHPGWLADIRRHQAIVDQNLALVLAQSQAADINTQAVRTDWQTLSVFIDKILLDLQTAGMDEAHAAYDQQGPWLFARATDTIGEAIITANSQANERLSAAETLRQELRGTVITVIVIALLVGASLSAALALAITAPLERLRDAMIHVNEGDPETHIPDTDRGDEIGDIARALEALKNEAWEKRNTQIQFETIFKATPDIVTISERTSSRYLDVNSGFENILGYRRDEVVGKKALELGIWATPEHRAALVEALVRDGRLSNFPSKGRRKNGELFDALVSAEQFYIGDTECMIFVARDVTNIKQQEDLLRRSLEELERSNHELERFAHVAAHDLQEPCRTICSFAQLLERSDGAHLSGDGREYLAFLSQGAIRMRAQIQGLLDYSRVTSTPAQFQMIELDQVVDWVLDELRVSLAEHHATIHREPLPTVMGDPVQLRQLFGNLINNGLKFQPPGQRAEIRIGAKPGDGLWHIAIADNGIGIDSQFHAGVFDLFSRLHGQEEYPGSGLGLTIAKRIIERHGGSIQLDSAPNQGTTIHFTLPMIVALQSA